MGCEGFLEKTPEEVSAMIGLMDERGCNCIDLYTPNPEMRTSLGRALRGRRGRFVLQAHLCTIWKDGQYKRTRKIDEVKEGFEDLLTRMELSSVEIGMIHYVDSMADWEEAYSGPAEKEPSRKAKTPPLRPESFPIYFIMVSLGTHTSMSPSSRKIGGTTESISRRLSREREAASRPKSLSRKNRAALHTSSRRKKRYRFKYFRTFTVIAAPLSPRN